MKTFTPLIIILTLLLNTSCSESDEIQTPAATFESTAEISAGPLDEITLRINAFDQNSHKILINGKQAAFHEAVGSEGLVVVAKVPYKCGSGVIELVDGTKKIQGPKFNYVNKYMGFAGPAMGINIARYSDDSFITWQPLITNKFSIVRFSRIFDDTRTGFPGLELSAKISTVISVPDASLAVYRMVGTVGMAMSPDNDVYFYQEYKKAPASETYYHRLLFSDLTDAGYVSEDKPEAYAAIHNVEIDAQGNMYTCEKGKPFIQINNFSAVTTFAGSSTAGHKDGTGAEAQFSLIRAITIDKHNNLYVADNNCIRKITPAGVVTTIAGGVEAGDKDGNATDARFKNVMGLFMASDGTLYIADVGNTKIKTLATDGTVTTLLGTEAHTVEGAETFHLYVDDQKNIYTMPGGKNATLIVFVHEDHLTESIYVQKEMLSGYFWLDYITE